MANTQRPEPETGPAWLEDYLILLSVGLVVLLSLIQLSTGWITLVTSNLMAHLRSFRFF